MKQLLLPLALVIFSIISLSIVHIDNINKLDKASERMKKKYTEPYHIDPEMKILSSAKGSR